MSELRELADALRERAAAFKTTANNCSNSEDRLALGVRADEAERCATAIDAALKEEEGDRQ